MDTSAIKQVIDEAITSNGSGEITGTVLNQVLNAMVDAMANVVSGKSGNIAYSDGEGGLLSSDNFKYNDGTVRVYQDSVVLGDVVDKDNTYSLAAKNDIVIGNQNEQKGIYLFDKKGGKYYIFINDAGNLVAELQS